MAETRGKQTWADREVEFQKFIEEANAGNKEKEPRNVYFDQWTDKDLLAQEGGNRSFIWSGHEDPFPDRVLSKSSTHLYYKGGNFPDNFKGGVSYVDGTDSEARKWIFAFDFAAQKVWVDASPTGPVDWNVVQVNLDASEKNMLVIDPVRKGVANGKIIGNSQQASMGFYVQN